jgi:uncharacterized membrane protein YbhN (UPF0104 family)
MRLLKLLIVALVAWGIARAAQGSLAELRAHAWSLHGGYLVLSGVFYLLGYLPAGIFWFYILRATGQRPRLLETLRAYYIGHLGKYVPGKAMVVVLRTGLIKSHRVEPAVAVVSVFLETLTMMAVGAFVAAGLLLAVLPHNDLLVLASVGLMLAAGLPTLPPVFRRLAHQVTSRRAAAEVRLEGVTFRLMLAGWLGNLLGWGLMGLSLWAAVRALGVGEAGSLALLPVFTASVALAVVAGFLSLIPGGALVRELVLAQVMVPAVGQAAALLSAVVLRLVWLVSELAISVILYGLGMPSSQASKSDVPARDGEIGNLQL